MNKKTTPLIREAEKYIPGGVNSPVRAFGAVGADPVFISRASGSKVYDTDGGEYIDYVGSWGPMILGHAHPEVVRAITDAAGRGTSYGMPTDMEIQMARLLVEAFPSMDMVRMVNSGTEATMSAIRLARAHTQKNKIIKFDGCYHGHADSLLVKAGSGVATLGIPGSPGVPAALAELTITVPFNSIDGVKAAVDAHGGDIACVIIEPVPGNMGLVLPQPGFLEKLRNITREKEIVLIFDEVISGFRLTYGGYQAVAGIEPDLTCLGKIIGGGLPVGAFGGKRHIMEKLAPLGPVYQAGTLSGNPLAMAAGIATLTILKERGDYKKLDDETAYLSREMGKILAGKGIAHTINRIGSMFTVFFTSGEVTDFDSAKRSNTGAFAAFFRNMLSRGVLLPPSQFETSFLSFAHTGDDLDATLRACREAARQMI